jgi:hypothetical protein
MSSIWFRHFPEFGVTLNVFGGALTRDEIMQFMDRLEPIPSRRWVNYLEPSLDLSNLRPEDFSVIKRALAGKLTELHGEAHLSSVLVSAAPQSHEIFLRFWPSLLGYDVLHPVKTAAVPTFRAACDRLGLPGGACEALKAAVSGA